MKNKELNVELEYTRQNKAIKNLFMTLLDKDEDFVWKIVNEELNIEDGEFFKELFHEMSFY